MTTFMSTFSCRERAPSTWGGDPVRLTQQTRYPWDGKVQITVDPERSRQFTLKIRIPGWTRGECVPSDLYHYQDRAAGKVSLQVNGHEVPLTLQQGYATINRPLAVG